MGHILLFYVNTVIIFGHSLFILVKMNIEGGSKIALYIKLNIVKKCLLEGSRSFEDVRVSLFRPKRYYDVMWNPHDEKQ